MTKAKPIYAVHYHGTSCLAMQPVKALNKKEARAKFSKRYGKKSVIAVDRIATDHIHYLLFKNAAI